MGFIIDLIKILSSNKKTYQSNENTSDVSLPHPRVYRGDYNQSHHPSQKPLAKWYEFGRGVSVKGYDIPDGLIYVGTNLKDHDGYQNDACLINPRLPVISDELPEDADEMGYWPRYDQISPKCRGAYLKWLATGRKNPNANIGCVFLFFYGLERRMFVDGTKGKVPPNERTEIVNEVKKLMKIYGSNRSFRRYANNFLAVEWAMFQNNDEPAGPEHINFNECYSIKPFHILLAKTVRAGKPIPSDMALQWYRLKHEANLRTPAHRCPGKLRNLFSIRYRQKYGDGIIVKPNKTPLKLEYHAASPSISSNMKLNVPGGLPNPFMLKAPINKIHIIVEKCTKELEAYSRYLGPKGNNPKSLMALSLIPKDLISRTSGAKAIRGRLTKICENGIAFLSLNVLYKIIGQNPSIKFGRKESESLAKFIENMDFGIAPDVRYHNMKPALDGNIAIFPKGHGIDFRPSKKFRTVCIIIRLGSILSQINKKIPRVKEAILQNLVISNRDLTKIEKKSLLAFLHWCIRTKQNASGLKAKVSKLSNTMKIAISRILLSIAHADGDIKPDEIKKLEKLYTILGLNKKQVTKDINALASQSCPVTVSLKDPDTSFVIPQPANPDDTGRVFALNEELIKNRQEETAQVRSVLEDIFSDREEKDKPEIIPENPAISDNPLCSLDETHQKLFHQLVEKKSWEKAAFREICKSLGLMVDGAMEVLNEWAFENADAPLIDDGDPIYIDISLAKEIVNAEQ